MSSASALDAQLEADGKTPKHGSSLYRRQDYWDLRFKREEHHEWLAKYDDVKGLINEYIPRGARVLLVGCGNSSLTADMAADGYTQLVSTDYSAVVIERMAAKHGDLGGCCVWEVADMISLPYGDATFDAVLDKAAMDAVVADGGDCWSPDDDMLAKTDAICGEAARVLKPGGIYVQVSFGQPHFRKLHILQNEASRWSSYKKHDVPVGFGYFLYALRRLGEPAASGGDSGGGAASSAAAPPAPAAAAVAVGGSGADAATTDAAAPAIGSAPATA